MTPQIRRATEPDVAAMAVMKAAAWREAYTGLVPDDVFARQERPEALERLGQWWREELAAGTSFWLAEDDGAIVGVANAMPTRGENPPAPLELTMIYLRESVKGTGLGDALLQRTIGDAPCCLWVLDGNERALAFYRPHRFAATGERVPAFTAHPDIAEIRLVRG